MDKLILMIEEMGIPFAYDHFAEGESPDPPTRGTWRWNSKWKLYWISMAFFMPSPRHGSTEKS